MWINVGPIKGRQKVVQRSGNTGKVLKVIGMNFATQAQAYTFVAEDLGYGHLDLDSPLTWIMDNGDLIKIEVIT